MEQVASPISTIEQCGKPSATRLKPVAPAGPFTMGASRREPGRRANENLRKVRLTRPFLIGSREVTNGEFRRFRPTHSSGSVQGFSLNGDDQPVVNVSWNEAARFCNWLSQKETSLYSMSKRELRNSIGA